MSVIVVNEETLDSIISRLVESNVILEQVDYESDDYTKGVYYASGYAQSAIRGTIMELLKLKGNE